MKKMTTILLLLTVALALYAGDVATFVDLGFSPDGSTYMFGQYGVTDADLRGYAEIYIVNIEKNAFVPGGVFRITPSAKTAQKDGKGLFNTLLTIAADKAKEYNIDHTKEGRPLYILTTGTFTEKTISFRDFEQNTAYTITLNESVYGSGKNVASSFALNITSKDESGLSNTITAGNPDYKRNGTKDYQIRRVITNPTENALICIVEKHDYDKRGDSIRFMVETLTVKTR